MKLIIFFPFILLILQINYIKSNTSVANETVSKKKYISFFLNSTIETLNDDNFEKKVLKGILNNFIILFTVKKCDICNNLITIFENVQRIYSNNTKLKFAKVDIFMSGWTAMRFEFEKIPNLIYISNRSYSVYPYDNITEDNIISFIEDENKDFKKYPKIMGYFDVFMKIFHIISGLLHEKFPFWNESYSWILVVLFIIFFCFVEFLIIKFCCIRKKKDIQKDKQNKFKQTHHIHEHKNDKKLIRNETKINKFKKD